MFFFLIDWWLIWWWQSVTLHLKQFTWNIYFLIEPTWFIPAGLKLNTATWKLSTYVFIADGYWFDQTVTAIQRCSVSQWDKTQQCNNSNTLHPPGGCFLVFKVSRLLSPAFNSCFCFGYPRSPGTVVSPTCISAANIHFSMSWCNQSKQLRGGGVGGTLTCLRNFDPIKYNMELWRGWTCYVCYCISLISDKPL